MKHTCKKTVEKRQLPVSKKFYAELRERVANACGLVMKGYEQVNVMMTVIDAYLFDRSEPPTDADRDTILIFALLRPEMDRALKRSEAARNRGRRRKENNPDEVAKEFAGRLRELIERHCGPEAFDDEETDDSQRPMNRRERRRYEQVRKRIARKTAKGSKKQAGVAVR